jgi:hypothetical protein
MIAAAEAAQQLSSFKSFGGTCNLYKFDMYVRVYARKHYAHIYAL